MYMLALGVAFAGSPPSITEPLRTGNQAPNEAAVVVGLERYAYVDDVPYAARDAEAMYNYLLYTRGIPAENITVLKSASGEQISEAVDEASARADGLVWIYFAGHGAADPSTGERMLLGDDVRADPAVFTSRGVKVAALQEKASAGGNRVVMMLDACYNGVTKDGKQIGKRFVVPDYAASHPKVTEWSAASPSELSGPFDAARHGAFTYFAVGAMRGWADGEVDGRRDGRVTAEEAQVYLSRALREIQLRSQTPVLTGANDIEYSRRVREKGPEVRSLRPPTDNPERDCPNPDEAALQATTELAMLRLAGAEAALGKLQDSLACAMRLQPKQVANYFQVEAVLYRRQAADPNLSEEERVKLQADSEADFLAARRIAPDYWNSDLGEGEAHDAFLATDVSLLSEERSVDVELTNLGSSEWVAIDGALVDVPVVVAPGVHVIQLGPANGPARFGRAFPARGLVRINLPPESQQANWRDVVVEVVELKRRRNPALLVASGVVAAAAGGTAVLALQQNDAMRDTQTFDRLDNEFGKQKVYGATSYALMGVAATGVGLHFVLPRKR